MLSGVMLATMPWWMWIAIPYGLSAVLTLLVFALEMRAARQQDQTELDRPVWFIVHSHHQPRRRHRCRAHHLDE